MTGGRVPAEAASATRTTAQDGSPTDAAATVHTLRNSLRLIFPDRGIPNPFPPSSPGSIGASSRVSSHRRLAVVMGFRPPSISRNTARQTVYCIHCCWFLPRLQDIIEPTDKVRRAFRHGGEGGRAAPPWMASKFRNG